MRRPLIASALLPLIVSGCGIVPNRDIRAYNACLVRHAQEPLVCEGPLQAYRVDASDLPTKAALPAPATVADTKESDQAGRPADG